MTFSNILQQQYKLSSDSILLLLKDAITISFNKKEPIVQEGQRNDYIYFVEKGSVRGFIEREGKEFTLLFAFEGDMAATMPSLSQSPTARNPRIFHARENLPFSLRIPFPSFPGIGKLGTQTNGKDHAGVRALFYRVLLGR